MNTTTLNMTTLDGGNVIIKKENAPAPPSGGESGGSNMEYLDLREVDETVKMPLFTFSTYVKLTGANGVTIMCTGMAIGEGVTYENADFIEIDFSALSFTSEKVEGGPIKEFISLMGINTDSIPRLTKEQFYSLD